MATTTDTRPQDVVDAEIVVDNTEEHARLDRGLDVLSNNKNKVRGPAHTQLDIELDKPGSAESAIRRTLNAAAVKVPSRKAKLPEALEAAGIEKASKRLRRSAQTGATKVRTNITEAQSKMGKFPYWLPVFMILGALAMLIVASLVWPTPVMTNAPEAIRWIAFWLLTPIFGALLGAWIAVAVRNRKTSSVSSA